MCKRKLVAVCRRIKEIQRISKILIPDFDAKVFRVVSTPFGMIKKGLYDFCKGIIVFLVDSSKC